MLANIQPLSSVTKDWDMELLTYNQGIHGAQDNMNAIVRLGINCPVVTGNWKEEEFKNFVKDWSLAAQAAKACKNLRIAVVGRMPGMGDITFDSSALLKKLGVEIVDESMGKIYSYFEKVTKKEIEDVKAENAKNFEIDPNLKKDQHDFAAKFQVAIEKFLVDNNYDGYSIYFDSVKDDGRFEQLPLMAASNLMAKGYGYGAEGDALAATVVKIGHILGNNGHFTEMYAMDFERDSVFMSHMGEGNWKVARKDKPIKLIDRFLGIGDLNNPPTVVFNVQPGEGTITSLAPLSEGNFRLVVSKGEVIDSEDYPNVEMPYFHFKPDTGVRNAMTNWLKNGGTHHQCFNIGDITRRWELFAKIVGIEYVRV
jgi:L-arabinose isomerase